MPSDKVIQILLSQTDLHPEQIRELTEPQAWRLVYSIPKPARDQRLQVCFTGFGATRRAELSALAVDGGLRVVTAVTRDLALLVCGSNAGPSKLQKAGAQGATILDEREFGEFMATGEIPDSSHAP